MKTFSNEKPKTIEIEMISKEKCYVILCDGITESEGGFEYDRYSKETYYADNLETVIQDDFESWLDWAKQPIETKKTAFENIVELGETDDLQYKLIDVSLLATDELYVMLEPLLENVTQPMMTTTTRNVSDETTTNTQGGNAMVDAYVAMVIRGLKTIDEVPARYREEVRRILAELDK